MSKSPVFHHPNYALLGGDRIVRNQNAPPLTAAEDEQTLNELARYIEQKIIVDFNFASIQIPDGQELSTSILASPNWTTATKILLIIQNSYGSQLGIFSRSICFDQGISKGTWLPYIERATSAGYAVLILRPNTNSISKDVIGGKPSKILIKGSESPEIHVLNVWENIISRAENVNHIALLGYGNGASLCMELYLREMVNYGSNNRVKAFITIEASSIIAKDESEDVKMSLGNISINLECNPAPMGNRLAYRKDQLGCTSVSLGLPKGVTEVKNVAAGVHLGMETVFKYLVIAESTPRAQVGKTFCNTIARDNGLDPLTAVVLTNPHAEQEPTPLPAAAASSGSTAVAISNATPPPPPQASPKKGFFSSLFGGGAAKSSKSSVDGKASMDEKLTVADFDLLKIVGKGAFGKVTNHLQKHIAMHYPTDKPPPPSHRAIR
jgi:hypothetical protein